MAKSFLNIHHLPRYVLIAFLVLVFLSGIYFIFWTGMQSSPAKEVVPNTIVAPVIDNTNITISATTDAPITDAPITDAPITDAPITDPSKCPDLLIRQGNQLMLYNTKMPEIPGQNPIQFNNLDDYIYYIKTQREQTGQYCPVLYLQQETDTQGQDVYRMRPGPFNQQAGLPINPGMEQSIGNFFQGQTQQGVLGRYANPNAMGPSPFNQSGPNAISLATTGSPLNTPTLPVLPQKLTPYIDASRENNNNQGYFGFDPQNLFIGKYTVLDQIHNSTKTQNANGLSDNPMDPNWGGAVFTNQQIMSGKYAGEEIMPYSGTSPTSLGGDPLSQPGSATNAPTSLPVMKPIGQNAVPQDAGGFGAKLVQAGGKSDNPMDADWGGVDYTNAQVASGKYDENNVAIAVRTQ